MNTTGIDRVYLKTYLFDLQKAKMDKNVSTKWVEVPDIETGETVKELVTTEREYLNDKHTGISLDKDARGVLVKFNPNRVLTNTHHEVRPQSEFPDACEKVIRILKDKHNVDIDLTGAKLIHLDLCRNAILDYPLQAYMPAFSMLDASRLSNIQHETGFYWKSENNTVVAYDKAYQVRKVFKIRNLPPTLARLETRHTSEGLKQKAFRFDTIDGLNSADVADRYDQFLTNRIFKQGKQLSIHPATSILETYLRTRNNGAVMRFVNDILLSTGGTTSKIEGIIDMYGSLDAFHHECKMLGVSKQRWRDFIKRLNEEDELYQRVIIKTGIKPVDLIDEIKHKFEIAV